MRGREGDFVEIADGSIFEVKGLVHPPDRLIAFPRYIPDPTGDRTRGSARYRKIYSFEDRLDFLRRSHPDLLTYDPVFGGELPEVKVSDVKTHYIPRDTLLRLRVKGDADEAERLTIQFTDALHHYSNVDASAFGVSGSIMIGLHTTISDVDIMIYGRRNAQHIREAIAQLMKEGSQIRPYSREDLLKLYQFRAKDTFMDLRAFLMHEERKTFQGLFRGREFFIRYVPDWGEVGESYGERRYSPAGYVKIKARVFDDSEALFTPCRYILDHVEVVEGDEVPRIREVVSFRGRFCEQAEVGETIVAQGKAERVEEAGGEYHRVVIGERRSDYMISLSLVEPN